MNLTREQIEELKTRIAALKQAKAELNDQLNIPIRFDRERAKAAMALFDFLDLHEEKSGLGLDAVKALCDMALRCLEAEARIARLEASVSEMKTSAGPEWWVVLKCGDRELTPYCFKIKGRAMLAAAPDAKE